MTFSWRQSSGRETRLLLLIVAVSAVALLVLAQLRFPEQPLLPSPPPTPLERLAARATFDELTSILIDVERRLSVAVVGLRLERQLAEPHGGAAGSTRLPAFVPALRVRPDAAVAYVGADALVTGVVGSQTEPTLLARDPDRGLVLVQVPPLGDVPPELWQPALSDRSRYVAVVEATAEGVAVRPAYLGRTGARRHLLWNPPLLNPPGGIGLTPGALVFSLDRRLIGFGVVTEDGAPAIAPALSVRAAAGELDRGGPSSSGDLGLEVVQLRPDLAAATGATVGVVVAWVDPEGPSAGAVEFGDVVEMIGGQQVATPYEFEVLVRRMPPGSTAVLRALRRGERADVSLTVGATSDEGGDVREDLGLTLRARPGIGAEVTRVAPGGKGARAGLRPGDVIWRIDARSRPTPADITRWFSRAQAGERLLLAVERGGQRLVFALEKP